MASNLLSERPENVVVNAGIQTYSGANKFNNTRSIPDAQLKIHTVYKNGHYQGASWDALLDPFEDDYLRLESETRKPNARAAWVLEVEQDGADYFNQEISAVVLSKLIEHPRIFSQSQMGPPRGRSGKFIDVVYYWKDTSDPNGNLKHVGFIGDFKRNVLKPNLWSDRKTAGDPNQVALSRELRGYAIEYGCPQIFCFDLNAFLFLQFRATKESKLSDANCPVDCWIFLRGETDSIYQSEPIREVLYRFIMQGIRRSQCHGCPVSVIGGLSPKGRLFFNGEPLWQREDGKTGAGHPLGYKRAVDENNGALAWKTPDGEWLTDDNGQMVYDSLPLWWGESSSEEDIEIYDAN
ncbi:hypothetical protein K456DRAFT_1766891 [Colletotrichum gloeosporioides 23]|nr:hypothetical protein K456DRAFT_1766891 [Colletotrichum gloeosporioides 23]